MNKILEISYKHKLSHLGSCLTTYPILKQIYENKKEEDIVILSAGHAGLAQYVLIEERTNGKIKAEDLLNEFGIHPIRNIDKQIFVSSGSLGCAVLIAVGLALSNKERTIFCVLSDGECAEGSVWEALCFCQNKNINNIKFHININGFSAYDCVDQKYLEQRLKIFNKNVIIHKTQNPKFLGGLNAHYYILKNKDEIEKILN